MHWLQWMPQCGSRPRCSRGSTRQRSQWPKALQAEGRTDFWRSLPARSHSIRRLWLVRTLPCSTCRMMMQCERLEAACRQSNDRHHTFSCTVCLGGATQPKHQCSLSMHVCVHDLQQEKTPHTSIHQRFRSDTAFNGRPQDTRQIVSAAQLCHAQCLCEHDRPGDCLLEADSNMMHDQ